MLFDDVLRFENLAQSSDSESSIQERSCVNKYINITVP